MAAHEDGWVSDLPAESVPIVEEPFSPTPARDLEDFLL
jgi:hypothetical protein